MATKWPETGRYWQKRAGAVPTEAQEQATVIQFFDSFAPTKGLDPRLLMASSNGAVLGGDARLRGIRAGILKRQGVRPGTPDLVLAVQRRGFGALWMEMKRVNGSVISPAQSELHYLMRREGYNVVVCLGADEAIRAIQFYVSGPRNDVPGTL